MENQSNLREALGKSITMWVIIATGVLGALGIILGVFYVIKTNGSEDGLREAKGMLQFIFSALLPLWGTWIGTVLAFYFSKENFEAATRSTSQLIKQITAEDKLRSTLVTEAMMPIEKIKTPTAEEASTIFRLTIFLDNNGIKRAILLDSNRVFQFIFHRSILDYFLTKMAFLGKSQQELKDFKTQDLVDNPDPYLKKVVVNCAVFVAENDNLLKAKEKMESMEGCNDIFVTKNGSRTEPVLGWISNVDIIRFGKF
jgi:hypothetical protein